MARVSVTILEVITAGCRAGMVSTIRNAASSPPPGKSDQLDYTISSYGNARREQSTGVQENHIA
jgi:hypothetical protein